MSAEEEGQVVRAVPSFLIIGGSRGDLGLAGLARQAENQYP